MNWKWYLGIFLLAVASLGVTLENTLVPNQEITVQFTTQKVTLFETEDVIAKVTSQLQSIGVKQIRVEEAESGKLKISYYSAVDIAFVKALFSETKELQFNAATTHHDAPNVPFKKDSKHYHLNVSNIYKNVYGKIGDKGSLVEIKSVRDQFVNPLGLFGISEDDISINHNLFITTYPIPPNSLLLVDTNTYKIPEVRAGPLS
ncbi:MAG: hypothetical protein R2781_08925 [Flavobacteriaceae bacterium]